MAAAIKAAERKRNVLILEKGERPGRKILASGNGRCNLMNSSIPRYYGNREFACKILELANRNELTAFLRHYGLMTTEEEDGRIYPSSYQSSSVMTVLRSALDLLNVPILTHQTVCSAEKEMDTYIVRCANGDVFSSSSLVIACGGAAQPKLGGSEDGYRILKSMGHSIVSISPSLVPLTTDSKSISGLSGIRARCSVSLFHRGRQMHKEKGEILFTDYGVSGICVMQCSRFASEQGSHLEIDFLSDLFPDEKHAFNEMRRRRDLYYEYSPIVLLEGIVHEKIAFAILKQAGIPMREEKVHELKDEDIKRVVQTAYKYKICITGNRGFEYAQVTAGGARCEEFYPETLESRIMPGLYATGEVLDVDGDCGGFNLMFAMASGLIAGKAV